MRPRSSLLLVASVSLSAELLDLMGNDCQVDLRVAGLVATIKDALNDLGLSNWGMPLILAQGSGKTIFAVLDSLLLAGSGLTFTL